MDLEKFENIECLVNGNGEISIGRYGHVRCAAVACDEGRQIVALVRKPNEPLEILFHRLDLAIAKAWEDEVYINEVNI